MSCESHDESISATIPDLDGSIPTTRVQLAIINNETCYITSMPCKSSNETVIAASSYFDVTKTTYSTIYLLLIDNRLKIKARSRPTLFIKAYLRT